MTSLLYYKKDRFHSIKSISEESCFKISASNELKTGYCTWFRQYRYNRRISAPIFVLDFQTESFWEENDDIVDDDFVEYPKQRKTRVNGVTVYFLEENGEKKRAFLKHEPYFYLLKERNRHSFSYYKHRIEEIGKEKVIKIESIKANDSDDLTFLDLKEFIKITVDHPGSVPKMRSECERIPGVVEWREADVLFHHRTAIDNDLRVGRWYNAEIYGGEIKSLHMIKDRAPPKLKIIAYDIETTFDSSRSLHTSKDIITMISVFTGEENWLIVNEESFDTTNVEDIDIVLRPSDETHSKPWIDYELVSKRDLNSPAIDRASTKTIKTKNEEELLHYFFGLIRKVQPEMIADFNGDKFDIPFIRDRANQYGVNFLKETGFIIKPKRGSRVDIKNEEYIFNEIDNVSGIGVIHLDAYLFNDKYSYLPKKDLALKASVKKKLKILPIEREALFAIKEDPVGAAAYAACDGYITLKYVVDIILDFYWSLGHLFPVNAGELFTRRAGSLDDLLIDAESFKNNIVSKKRLKQLENLELTPNINVKTLTYTGGLVEARRHGIWRSDLLYPIEINRSAENVSELKNIIATVIKTESEKIGKKSIKDELENLIFTEFSEFEVDLDKNFDEIIRDISRKENISPEKKQRIQNFRNKVELLNEYQVIGVSEEIDRIQTQIDAVYSEKNIGQVVGLHVDVTSMYPSQIRQYKLQPSGIVSSEKCKNCEYKEKDMSCRFDGKWIIKLSAHRPCKLRILGKCNDDCSPANETSCNRYTPLESKFSRSQELFTYSEGKTNAYRLTKKGILKETSLENTYFGSEIREDPFDIMQSWLKESMEEPTELITDLENNVFDIIEDFPRLKYPKNIYMAIDVRQKLITILLSVQSFVCQKAYDHVSRIMEEFFQTRVFHKKEATRLKKQIKQLEKSKKGQSLETKIQNQKFHDSTQLGLKVPLNSLYGLLGMKGGVRNSSTPSAGITTRLSAQLIHWASMELEKIGMVTELDTDGVWMWVPRNFPLSFNVFLKLPDEIEPKKIEVTLIDKILNEEVNNFSRNDNYWTNDGKNIVKSPKGLIGFEQDPYSGHYDFQLVLGKKKYIVFSNSKGTEWKEEELTGLETKRADFSDVQKFFQSEIIQSFLKDFSPDKPKPLKDLYINAIYRAEEIKQDILSGRFPLEKLVKPKAINKPLSEYKSKLPQIEAARMLQRQGYTIEPGSRINLLQVKGGKVIPLELFSLEYKRIKSTLMKSTICTLDFVTGNIKSKDDLYKIVDLKHYLGDLFDSGRIYHRMITNLMEKQSINISDAEILSIQNEISNNESFLVEKETDLPAKMHIVKKRPKKPAKSERTNKEKVTPKKSIKKSKKSSKKTKTAIDEKTLAKRKEIMQKAFQVEEDEILEMEHILGNGNGTKIIAEVQDGLIPEEGYVGCYVCSECGLRIEQHEYTDKGCKNCGGQVEYCLD